MKQTAEKFAKRYSTYSGNQYLMESLESWLEGFNFYSVYAEHSHCSLDSFYITIEKDEDGDEDEYDIVGSTEADPTAGKISDEPPVGAALMNHGVGDTVEVSLPSGAVISYQILAIGKSVL